MMLKKIHKIFDFSTLRRYSLFCIIQMIESDLMSNSACKISHELILMKSDLVQCYTMQGSRFAVKPS